MFLRPADASGDILPVGSSSAMLSGPGAVAQLVKYRLSLLRGEWWENPEWGFFVLEALQSSRLTEAESAAVSAQISAYIREIPGVLEVGNVQFSVSSCSFSMPALCGQGREAHRSGLKPASRQQNTGAAAPVMKNDIPSLRAKVPRQLEFVR